MNCKLWMEIVWMWVMSTKIWWFIDSKQHKQEIWVPFGKVYAVFYWWKVTVFLFIFHPMIQSWVKWSEVKWTVSSTVLIEPLFLSCFWDVQPRVHYGTSRQSAKDLLCYHWVLFIIFNCNYMIHDVVILCTSGLRRWYVMLCLMWNFATTDVSSLRPT